MWIVYHYKSAHGLFHGYRWRDCVFCYGTLRQKGSIELSTIYMFSWSILIYQTSDRSLFWQAQAIRATFVWLSCMYWYFDTWPSWKAFYQIKCQEVLFTAAFFLYKLIFTECRFWDVDWRLPQFAFSLNLFEQFSNLSIVFGSRYSRMDQVKYLEDSL